MIIHGDSLEALKTLPENSVDAVVTDPPYGLSFMGKKWDYNVPSTDLWIEVYRVLKPGGHLLSFGGTRTYHRMVVQIEDAGFEIRDQIQWIYGSGFPKSLDVSKAIDKAAGAEREVVGKGNTGPNMRGGNYKADGREVEQFNITAPATPDAIKWQGFGTALKPANEPIVLARKPLSESTVAKNVLKHGTGALNIDGTRIAGEDNRPTGLKTDGTRSQNKAVYGDFNPDTVIGERTTTQGRWPANVLFDEEAAAMLDDQSGTLKSGGNTQFPGRGSFPIETQSRAHYKEQGGASRFFYVAKASKRERNAGLEGMPLGPPPGSKRSKPAPGASSPLGQPRANHHPTVKPIKLMEYLCKLITPPGGMVLDPFCGSGSTGVAAINLGFKFIGIEREAEYVAIASKRVANVLSESDDVA